MGQPAEEFRCPQCRVGFDDARDLAEHDQVIHPFRCPVPHCEAVGFTSSRGLDLHMEKAHPPVRREPEPAPVPPPPASVQVPSPSGRPKARCGTESGYGAHRKRGETPCGPCRDAVNEAMKRRKAARRADPRPDANEPQPIRHGTYAGAQAHRKRDVAICESCREAERAYNAAKRARRRGETSTPAAVGDLAVSGSAAIHGEGEGAPHAAPPVPERPQGTTSWQHPTTEEPGSLPAPDTIGRATLRTNLGPLLVEVRIRFAPTGEPGMFRALAEAEVVG